MFFEPVRGGTRGGQAEFKWSDVSADKDRENYLGHSINAPTGRWQKNKDVHWYNREKKDDEEQRLEEIRKIKEAEAEALSTALGFGPSKKSSAVAESSNANEIPLGGSRPPNESTEDSEKAERRKRKLEKRALKAEKKAAKKAQRHADRDASPREDDSGRYRRDQDHSRRSRSRSPTRRHYERRVHPERRRSRSPAVRERHPVDYDESARTKERERDRRRWDDSIARRDTISSSASRR